jgi:hypothetical protein
MQEEMMKFLIESEIWGPRDIETIEFFLSNFFNQPERLNEKAPKGDAIV